MQDKLDEEHKNIFGNINNSLLSNGDKIAKI